MTTHLPPSFVLDFTSAFLDPRVAVARALNTATATNVSGFVSVVNADLPRFDYDPITLACRGLLIEESRTNLQTYSVIDSNWAFTNGTLTSETTTAPDGAASVNTFTETTAFDIHRVTRSLTLATNTTYTMSVYVKQISGATRYVTIGSSASTAVYIGATFDVIAKTMTQQLSAGVTYVSSSVTNALNGFVRVSLTFTTGATALTLTAIGLSSTATHINTSRGFGGYLGSTSVEVAFWGAQLEAGAFATSYIPTTTTALTRNADIATIAGTNFSDFWQAGKGGVLVRARPGSVSGTRPWLQFDDGTADNIIALRGNTTNPELYIRAGGVDQATIDAGTIAANTDYSLTGWWATNDCKARLNSGAVVTGTSATIPTVTQARLGSDGTNYLNGHLASISYYKNFTGAGSRIYTRRKNKAIFNLM